MENLKTTLNGYRIDFELSKVPIPFVNGLRRILLAEIPTVVIRDVVIRANTTQLNHEMLKHRVLMLPVNVQASEVGVIRDKKPVTLNVIVGDRTKVFAEQYGGKKDDEPETPAEAAKMKFGMSVQAIRPADREGLGYKGKNGVLVGSVETGSFADDIGLQKGDIIVELNRQSVDSPDDIRKMQNSLKVGDSVAFHVMRQARGARGGGGGDWQSLFLAGSVPAAN